MQSKFRDAVEFFKPKIKGEKTREFYCYVYELNGKPIYVGIGQGDRYLHHLTNALRPGKAVSGVAGRLKEYKRDMNNSLVIRFSLQSDKRENVIKKELELIARFGRQRDGGTLENSTLGGDGGNTYGDRFFVHNGVTEKLVSRVPPGWERGRLARFSGYKWWHNPTTGQEARLPEGSTGPKGFILGKKKGLGTGPVIGSRVWHHPKSGDRIWLRPGEFAPRGYVEGRGYGSTSNRVSYYSDELDKTIFIAEGVRPPKGFAKGMKPKTGYECVYKRVKYSNAQSCMEATGLTRYALYKAKSFKR